MFFRRKQKEEIAVEEAPPAAEHVAKMADGPQAVLLDELGLYHGWYLELRLREEAMRAGRADNPFSLVAWQLRLLPGEPLDLELLSRAAAAILKGLRWYDVAAQFSAQCFVAILFDADYELAATVAYRIKADLQTRMPGVGRWQAGLATFGREGVDADSLLQAALRRQEKDARAA